MADKKQEKEKKAEEIKEPKHIKEKKEVDLGEGLKKAGVAVAAAAIIPAVGIGAAAKKAVDAAKVVAERIKEENQIAQLRKYNPLFPEEYASVGFHCPNMLTIVDDSDCKDKGSLGWRSIENNMEVLHLYDGAIKDSGLRFVPAAMCHAIYYVDPHDSKQFINIDNLYEKMQQQKLAELANVAYCLGAKSYTIEIVEEESKSVQNSGKAGIKGKAAKSKADISAKHTSSVDEKAKRLAFVTAEFSKNRTPVAPELCWFKGDPIINGLVAQICKDGGTMKSNELVLEGSKYAVLAKTTAAQIEGAVKKMGLKTDVDINQEAKSEFSSKIHFHLEF